MSAAPLRLAGLMLCAIACSASQAQTTISGTLDGFIGRTSTPEASATVLESSGLGVSRIAIRHTEAIAAGLNVTAFLEGGIGLDTGSSGSQPGGLFNRRSYLSVRGGPVQLTVGKQYSPHLVLLAGEMDLYATSFWATPYSIFQGGGRYMLVPGAVALDVTLLSKDRLKLSAMWARREDDALRKPAGKQNFYGALYQVSDQLKLGASVVVDRRFSRATPDARLHLIGINYDTGVLRVSGGFQSIGFKQAGTARVNEFCLGAGYLIGARDLAQVNFGKTMTAGSPERYSYVYGISLVHDLSKRTALYAGAGYLRNGLEQQDSFDMPVRPGMPSNNLMLGMRHYF